MKKLGILIAVAAFVVLAVPAMAAKPEDTPNENANRDTVLLVEKTPYGDWPVVVDGASGVLKYHKTGPKFNYEFKAEGLLSNTDYTLMYYPDPWPGEGLVCIDAGVSTEDGKLHMAGSTETGTLPMEDDDNYGEGAKVWLVLSDDVECEGDSVNMMVGWSPYEYLFENNLITYDEK